MSKTVIGRLLNTLEGLEIRLKETTLKQNLFKAKMKKFTSMENSTIFAALAQEIRSINLEIDLVEDIFNELKAEDLAVAA